jgi:hypothetical protein
MLLPLIAGARGAINSLMAEVIEDHIRMHVVGSAQESDAEQAQAAEELNEVVRSYLRWSVRIWSRRDDLLMKEIPEPPVSRSSEKTHGRRRCLDLTDLVQLSPVGTATFCPILLFRALGQKILEFFDE